MVSVSEVVKTWQEGFANKDSSKLGEFFTDDFRFVSNVRDIGKQETLDWTATGEMAIDNIEVIYENDEVAVKCGPNVATRSNRWQHVALGWGWF